MEQIDSVCQVARDNDMRLHLDGARLWNATAVTGIPESEYSSQFDSVSVCFSKGLGAPVGSILAGDEELIQRARHIRKQFGGGMRQVGIIAAGALFALEHHRQRLVDDHHNAHKLAAGISSISGLQVDTASVSTNMVYFDVMDKAASVVADKLSALGVLVLALTPQRIRAVTSLAVDAAAIERAVSLLGQVMDEL
jgi:threonine aldolase